MAQDNINAWIFLEEDAPKGTSYRTPGSCYQSLVENSVYKSTDMVSICWVNTVQSGGEYSIALQSSTHPDGSTNQQYMQWLIADAKRINTDVKILVMLGYGNDEISQIFSGDESNWSTQADRYAENIVAYLKQYGLDGFDVDWEPGLSSNTTTQQFALAFGAMGAAFAAQNPPLILTISPSTPENLDAPTVNQWFGFVTPQFYCGVQASAFTEAGIDERLLAYGAKFETDGGVPYQTAQGAFTAFRRGKYHSLTQWRLNSGDYQFEQAQQMILYQMVHGLAGPAFDDAPIIAAAGNPQIRTVTVRYGDVVDAIQATNEGALYEGTVTYPLIQHGGDSGRSQAITIDQDDAIVTVSGYTGIWFGNACVLQITLRTRQGRIFGPYGSMAHVSSKTSFTITAPTGSSIVAFSGTTLTVSLAGGQTTAILGTLGAAFG